MIRDKMPLSKTRQVSTEEVGQYTADMNRESAGRMRRQPDPMKQMLDYLYQTLKAQYPGVEEPALRNAAKKLFMEIRQQQQDEFNQRFNPEPNVSQDEFDWNSMPAPRPSTPPQPSPPQQSQTVGAAQPPRTAPQPYRNVSDIPKFKPGAPVQSPGMAQPIQPPSQGTPYGQSDPEIAALNAAETAKGPGVGKRYYRDENGNVQIAQ